MTQIKYHNFEAGLESLPENNRALAFTGEGALAGFDTLSIVSGTNLKIQHTKTGIKVLNPDANANLGPFGVVVSRQGVVVYDDGDVLINTPYITVNPRVDLIIAQHTHLDSPGGSSMVFSRVQGAENQYPIPPSLPDPLTQVLVGYLKVYGTANHDLTVLIPYPRKGPGNTFPLMKSDARDIMVAEESDFDKLQTTGFFHINSSTHAPNSDSLWLAIILRRAEMVIQIAISPVTGRMYSRSSATINNTNYISTWKPWMNLNNIDVPSADFSTVMGMIGDRQYTDQNFVVNDQSLTDSVDALDIAMETIEGDLDTATTNIANHQEVIDVTVINKNEGYIGATALFRDFPIGLCIVDMQSSNHSDTPANLTAIGLLTTVEDSSAAGHSARVQIMEQLIGTNKGDRWVRRKPALSSFYGVWDLILDASA